MGSVRVYPLGLARNTFQLGGLALFWGVRNDEINCLLFTSRLKAHQHKPFVYEFVGVHRLTAYTFLDYQPNSV